MKTLREQMAALKSAVDQMIKTADDEGRELTSEEAADIEAKSVEHAGLKEQQEKADRARDLVRSLGGGTPAPQEPVDPDEPEGGRKSLGARIASSGAFKAFREAHPHGADGGMPISLKAAAVGDLSDIGMKATLDTGTGQVRPNTLPGYQDYTDPTRRYPPSILDLVTVGTTDLPTLEYRQVLTVSDGSAVVPEGALKPLSDLTTGAADAKAHVYADGFDATNQFLSDEGALATFMEQEIQRNLRNKIEDKLLNGAGGASDPRGILATSGVQTQSFEADVITTVARALEKLQATNVDPQAIVLHPRVLWALRLLQDGNGQYRAGGPFAAGTAASLWGVPLVSSYRVAPSTALVGDFRTVNFLQLEPLNVLAFNQHKDYAQRNMVYVRAELRALQVIYSPRSIVRATIAAAA